MTEEIDRVIDLLLKADTPAWILELESWVRCYRLNDVQTVLAELKAMGFDNFQDFAQQTQYSRVTMVDPMRARDDDVSRFLIAPFEDTIESPDDLIGTWWGDENSVRAERPPGEDGVIPLATMIHNLITATSVPAVVVSDNEAYVDARIYYRAVT